MSARLYLAVTPGARQTELTRATDGLRLRIAAPAAEGKANRALMQYLAGALNVPPSTLQLSRGIRGRYKVVEFLTLDADDLNRRVDELLGVEKPTT